MRSPHRSRECKPKTLDSARIEPRHPRPGVARHTLGQQGRDDEPGSTGAGVATCTIDKVIVDAAESPPLPPRSTEREVD